MKYKDYFYYEQRNVLWRLYLNIKSIFSKKPFNDKWIV